MLAHDQISFMNRGIEIRTKVTETWMGDKPINRIQLKDVETHQDELNTFFAEMTSYMHKISCTPPGTHSRRIREYAPASQGTTDARIEATRL
jgi:hypothetical protein